MKPSGNVVGALRDLNALEDELASLSPRSQRLKTLTRKASLLRGRVPEPLLAHYDRMRARGRPSVAPVRGTVCGGCHLTIPVGRMPMLKLENEILVCDNCGAYLYLAEETAKQPAAAPSSRKLSGRKTARVSSR